MTPVMPPARLYCSCAGRAAKDRIGLAHGREPLSELGEALHLSEAAGQRTVDGRVGQARQLEGKIGSPDLAGAAVALAQLETRVAMEQDAFADFEQVRHAAVGVRDGRGHTLGKGGISS